MATRKAFKTAVSHVCGIGIDISKSGLELCALSQTDTETESVSLVNDVSDIHWLSTTLKKGGYEGKIIMESTGYYHWLCAVILTEAGLDVRLVNPLLASKHHKSAIRGSKTDQMDAYRLATMAITERDLPKPWEGDRQWVEYRHKVGILCAIDKTLQQLKASLGAHQDALKIMGVTSDPMVEQWREHIRSVRRTYEAQRKALGEALGRLSDGEDYERIASITGVSGYAAGLMCLLLRKDVRSDRAWVAFAGLDIRSRESGQWTGRGKLSKRGNAHLRKVLYQTAWGLKQNDPGFKAYYQRLRDQGRPYVECLLMVARKFLRVCFILIKTQQQYNPDLLMA